VSAGLEGLEGRDSCLRMVERELASAERAAAAEQAEAERAVIARQGSEQALARLQLSNKARLSALRVQIDSESGVRFEQQRYITSLNDRLRDGAPQVMSSYVVSSYVVSCVVSSYVASSYVVSSLRGK
jgi:hypothetical protein